jgi:hypothetical protein
MSGVVVGAHPGDVGSVSIGPVEEAGEVGVTATIRYVKELTPRDTRSYMRCTWRAEHRIHPGADLDGGYQLAADFFGSEFLVVSLSLDRYAQTICFAVHVTSEQRLTRVWRGHIRATVHGRGRHRSGSSRRGSGRACGSRAIFRAAPRA